MSTVLVAFPCLKKSRSGVGVGVVVEGEVEEAQGHRQCVNGVVRVRHCQGTEHRRHNPAARGSKSNEGKKKGRPITHHMKDMQKRRPLEIPHSDSDGSDNTDNDNTENIDTDNTDNDSTENIDTDNTDKGTADNDDTDNNNTGGDNSDSYNTENDNTDNGNADNDDTENDHTIRIILINDNADNDNTDNDNTTDGGDVLNCARFPEI